jgi:undecaprenyl-diphosphatase
MTVTLAVVGVALAAAVVVFVLSAVRTLPDPIDVTGQERALVGWLARRPRLRRFVRERLDRRTAGGLALTVALLALFAVALITGLVLDMIDHAAGLASLDDDAAAWGAAHADSGAVRLFLVLTWLGDTVVVVAALVVTGLVDCLRHRRVDVLVFLGVVIAGEKLVVNGLKEIVDRARPEVLQLVGWEGPSFPSGHAAAAAAVWPAVALVLTRGSRRIVRAGAAAVAALISFAVAASRAVLGVHWLTDVVTGLVIGYGWFVVCAVLFGGRAQRLGDPASRSPSASAPADREGPFDAGSGRRADDCIPAGPGSAPDRGGPWCPIQLGLALLAVAGVSAILREAPTARERDGRCTKHSGCSKVRFEYTESDPAPSATRRLSSRGPESDRGGRGAGRCIALDRRPGAVPPGRSRRPALRAAGSAEPRRSPRRNRRGCGPRGFGRYRSSNKRTPGGRPAGRARC